MDVVVELVEILEWWADGDDGRDSSSTLTRGFACCSLVLTTEVDKTDSDHGLEPRR